MGNEQSSSSSGSGVSSSISFLAGKRSASVKRSNQIVVVRPGQDPIGDPDDDVEIKRLQEIRRFLPILKSALPGMRDSPEVFLKVGSKPILKFCYRIQEHLAVCAKTVSAEQTLVQSKIKLAEHTSAVAVSKYQDAAQHTEKLSAMMKKIKSTNQKLSEIENALKQIVPKAEELGRLINEVLPADQQLPPLNMAKIMYRSPPPSSQSSVDDSPVHLPARPATATVSNRPNNHIMPVDEHRVVDRFSLKTMTDTDFTFINPDVALNTVKPLDLKRTIAFANFYLSQVASLLNKFSQTAENKILAIERRLERVETELLIIEEKLQSVPGLNTVPPPQVPQATSSPQSSQPSIELEPSTNSQPTTESYTQPEVAPEEPIEEERNVLKNSDHPTYSKYFKMIKMGVIEAAVRQKMIVEGLDPSVLDNPNAACTLAAHFSDDDATSESTESFYNSD